jgi:hypothetical protein
MSLKEILDAMKKMSTLELSVIYRAAMKLESDKERELCKAMGVD